MLYVSLYSIMHMIIHIPYAYTVVPCLTAACLTEFHYNGTYELRNQFINWKAKTCYYGILNQKFVLSRNENKFFLFV